MRNCESFCSNELNIVTDSYETNEVRMKQTVGLRRYQTIERVAADATLTSLVFDIINLK